MTEEAFQAVFARYRGQIVNYIARRVGGRMDVAEDLAQDTFVRFFRAARRTERVRGYLHTIALGLTRNFHRDEMREKRDVRRTRPLTYGSQPLTRASDVVEVRDLLSRLTAEQQEALYQNTVCGRSVRECADRWGVSENVADWRVRKARTALAAIALA
jgi:RNA polymerase sigma-70 factor (ECF subfamily)